MPKFKDLQINIYANDKPLSEMATHRLARSNITSTWIESKSDQAFSIKIKTQQPWDFSESNAIDKHGGKPVPYSLCIEIHFDGRAGDAERSAVIYLDDEGDATTKTKIREHTIRSSFVTRLDGSLEEQTWVFRDTGGIDHIFEKLCLDPVGKEETLDTDDRLSNALMSTKLGSGKSDEMTPRSKLGQILIKVQRVQVSGRKSVAGNLSDFTPKRNEETDDMDIGNPDDQITHTVAGNTSAVMKPRDMRVLHVTSYMPDLGPYAQFTFFYRSRKQLAKMGIIPASELASRSRRRKFGTIAAQMVSLNTLNERKRLDKLQTSKIAETYEDRVKNKTLRPYKKTETSRYSGCLRRSAAERYDSSIDECEDAGDSPPGIMSRQSRSKTKSPAVHDEDVLKRSPESKLNQAHPQDARYTPQPRRSKRILLRTQQLEVLAKNKISGKEVFREKVKETQEESENESEAETEHEADDLDNDSYEPNPDEETEDHQKMREQFDSIDIRKRGRDCLGPSTWLNELDESGSDAIQDSDNTAGPSNKKKAKTTPLKVGNPDSGDQSSSSQPVQPPELEISNERRG